MLVKAKWNVKDAAGWHSSGDVFETDADLGDAVEVIAAETKKAEAPVPEPAPVKEPEQVAEEAPVKVAPSRRKKVGK